MEGYLDISLALFGRRSKTSDVSPTCHSQFYIDVFPRHASILRQVPGSEAEPRFELTESSKTQKHSRQLDSFCYSMFGIRIHSLELES